MLKIIVGFAFGLLVGYLWRDRISRRRRAKYLAARRLRRERQAIRQLDMEGAALAPLDDFF